MITDEQKNLIVEINNSYGIEKKEVRSYEVSLWTLQDSFITVLKWSDVEQKGRIENPKMILDIDGTQEFTFSIPMYYHQDGILQPNPNWYTIHSGNLITGLRKIKVIFNKEEPQNKKVFEFIILDVEELHENDVLTCNVKCEGLAFHELGKIGYKLSLSYDEYYERYKKWAETGIDPEPPDEAHPEKEPMADLAYWCEKTELQSYEKNRNNINPNIWYYKINMNWHSFENGLSNTNQRLSNQVYEETYTTSWDTDLKPLKTQSFTIKQRMVDAKNSNKYNITQTIAETFGVFCAYEYGHDDNNQIISRTVIFYNNFFKEEDGYLSLTYPYDTNKISRKMDSTDLTTKLYVLKVDDDTTLQGFHSIMDSEANKTKEDYILNFDYLHEIGTISDEQYEEIGIYEKKVRQLNDELVPLQQRQAAIEADIVDLEARKTVLENAIKLDQEQVDANNALKTALVQKYGDAAGSNLVVTSSNPASAIIIPDGNSKGHIVLKSNLGIIFQTIKFFSNVQCTAERSDSDFTAQYNEAGNLEQINNLIYNTEASNIVYMTYSYNPDSYYDKVLAMWDQRLANDSIDLSQLKEHLGEDDVNPENKTGLYETLEEVKTDISNKLSEKKKLILQFEQMMGPALREGYWQPDDYSDYGDIRKYTTTLNLTADSSIITADTGNNAQFIWDFGKEESTDEDDSRLFYNEQKLYYTSSAALQQKIYYPIISVANLYKEVDLTEYSFYFDTNYNAGEDYDGPFELKYRQFFSIGSQAKLVFIKNKTSPTILPAIVLLGAKTLTEAQITRMKNTGYIGKINYTDMSLTGNGIKVEITNDLTRPALWVAHPDAYEVVYPRIKFSSMNLKTQSSDIIIHYDTELLSMFNDYYINTRETKRNDIYYTEYFVTLKPEVIFRHLECEEKELNVHYIISNANTSIYLDALEISHENAYPKVSYELEAHLIDTKYYENSISHMNLDYTKYWVSHTLYNRLAQLLMINDTELKFKDTFGYISRLNLDLDAPWKDTIEVRNYKTKFEDLFSTIVASTEEMKRISQGISGLLSGQTGLSNVGFTDTLSSNAPILNNYLDTYFNTSPTVEEKLTSIFNEAGSILADASKGLDNIRTLNTENAAILASFVQDIGSEVAVQTYTQVDPPITFKAGDIWIQIDEDKTEKYRYLAVCNSSESNSGDGWGKIYDGTLAQIKGANLNVDAVTGIIDIKAENQINMGSGGNIYIAANERVDIVGNKAINIGGTTINLLSGRNSETEQEQISGINLISSGGNNVQFENGDGEHVDPQGEINDLIENSEEDSGISKVLINPTKIEMASANILMRGKNKIQMVASKNSLQSTSAISLDPDKGVWIGSGKGIKLYSGDIDLIQNTDGTFSPASGIGASVELLPTRLLFGVSNTDRNATAVEMTDSYFILGAGDQMDTLRDYNFINGNLIGVKATKDYIGLATGTGTDRSLVYISPTKIVLGTSYNHSSGSYVDISKTGIEIGTGGSFSVNANDSKFILRSNASGYNTNLYIADNATWKDATQGIQYSSSGGLKIKGNINATSGSIGGWFIGSDYIGTAATRDTSNVGLCSASNIRFWAGGIRNQDPPFYVLNDGTLKSTKATISGNITATTLSVGSGNNLLTYDSTNGLIVKGNITANSGLIGNYWNISPYMLTNTVSGDYGYLQKVFLGLTSKHNINWIMYAGANSPEGEGSDSNWTGDRDVWAPFRISTRGELYTEILCLGNGPASVSGHQTCGGEGWADYIGKLWLFVKYAEGDYRWECITSTQLWNALKDINELWAAVKSGNSSSSNQGSIAPSKPKHGCFIAGTQVELYDGSTINIEKLQVGLKVKSYNEITHQIEMGEIASVQMLKHKNQIYDLILSNDTILTLTDSHPVLTTTGWGSLNCEQAYREHEVLTKLLHEGDELVTINNEKVYIKQIKYRDDLQDETVYTCHVEPCRTFVVEKVVVHNMYAYDK